MSELRSSSNPPIAAPDAAQAERLAAFERGEIDAEAAGLVHFSRACWLESDAVTRANELAFLPFVIGICGVAALMFAQRTLPHTAYRLGWMVVVLAACVAAGLYVRSVWRRGREVADALLERADATPDAAFRVCYCGTRAEISNVGELGNVPFEPQTVALPIAPQGCGFALQRSFQISVALGVIVLAIAYAMGFRPGVVDAGALLGASFFVGTPIATALWQVHLRITPGIVEIVEHGPFRVEPLAITRLDVASRPLIVDLRRRVLLFDVTGARRDISFAWTRDPARIAFFLLLAAISTHRGPAMESDEPEPQERPRPSDDAE